MKKFWVIQNIPSPYRLTMFDEMYRQLSELGVEFHVHLMARGHKGRPKSWLDPQINFPHTYWKDHGVRSHHFNPGLICEVLRAKPDYLLVGNPFDTFTSILVAMLYRHGVRACWVEGQTKTPGKTNGFVGWFKRYIFSKFPLAAVPGSDAKRYFEMHQARTRRKMPSCIYLPNLVDEKRFKVRSEWQEMDIMQMRESLGVKSREKLCLIIARLSSVKGLLPFFERLSHDMLLGWKIVIFGEGPQKSAIEEVIMRKRISDNVRIFPYIKYSDMPLLYAASDLFLLPSMHDPNPLSVAEALHSGLPVAISSQCGNVEEGCTDGHDGNGWVLPVLDQEAYPQKLKEVFAAGIDELRTKGRVSKSVNSKFWDSKKSIAKFLKDFGV